MEPCASLGMQKIVSFFSLKKIKVQIPHQAECKIQKIRQKFSSFHTALRGYFGTATVHTCGTFKKADLLHLRYFQYGIIFSRQKSENTW